MNFVFDNDRPIYIQLVEQIKMQIISGKYKPGERLLSVRDLALEMKVNPNTMQRALVELENINLIYTERTNGKYVTTDYELIKGYRDNYAKEKVLKYFNDMMELGYTKEEATEIFERVGVR